MKEEGEFATTLQMYADLPFTTLFVDGNHENFDLLNAYPVEIWNGGKVHKISPDIIHLMRGQVFGIEGKTFFAFGGATGADKCLRIEGYDWFPQEIPSREEYEEGVANLKKYHNTVDYIVTHTCDEKALWYPPLVTRVSHREVCPENLTDIYGQEQENGVAVGYKLFDNGDAYFHLFKIFLDNSLALIEIERAHRRICRKKFYFQDEIGNNYTLVVVNVKFNYTYKPIDNKPITLKQLREHFYEHGG